MLAHCGLQESKPFALNGLPIGRKRAATPKVGRNRSIFERYSTVFLGSLTRPCAPAPGPRTAQNGAEGADSCTDLPVSLANFGE